MKILPYSDIHLERSNFYAAEVDADVVILAGDIDAGLGGVEFANEVAEKYGHVIYVAGNHEYYFQDLTEHQKRMRGTAAPNVHVLENDSVVVDGVRFLGCTLWTDFNLYNDIVTAMAEARKRMADFRFIRHRNRNLTPEDTVGFHEESKAWLAEQLAQPHEGPTVVVTHHAPSSIGTAPHHRGDVLTPAFCNGMTSFVDESDAALWIHGHTHYCLDTRIGNTRVVSNQRGYSREGVQGFKHELVIEV